MRLEHASRHRFRHCSALALLCLAVATIVGTAGWTQGLDCAEVVDAEGNITQPDGCWFAGTGGGETLPPATDPAGPSADRAPDPAPVNHRVIDAGELLRDLADQASDPEQRPTPGDGTPASPEDIAGDIGRAVYRPGGQPPGTSTTVRYDDDDFILAGLPVVIDVKGDWGEWRVTCDMTFVFQRRGSGAGWTVEMGVWGGVFDAGYVYDRETDFLGVTNYVDSPLGDEPAPFVSGHFFVNQECGFGPLAVPDSMTPGLVAQIQAQQEACIEAVAALGLNVFSPDQPTPMECIALHAMSASYAQTIGLNEDRLAMMQRCLPQAAAALGDERLMSDDCAAEVRAFGQQVESALGMCPLDGGNTGALRVFDPHPYTFTAIYSARHTRWDCKSYQVTAYINGAADFELMAVLPEPDQCLVVEPEQPAFHLFFTDTVDESEPLETVVRLRLAAESGTVPLNVAQEEDGHLRLDAKVALDTGRAYVLEVKVGDDGVLSQTWATLAHDDLMSASDFNDLVIDPDWVAVSRFHASPISRNQFFSERGTIEAGVYQVSRDAPLLRDRPTAFRIWYDWGGDANDPDRYLTEFCARIEVARVDDSDALLLPPHDALIRLPPLHDDEDGRMGRDSQNLFDWRPDAPLDGVTIKILPQRYWEDLPGHAADDPPEYMLDHPVTFMPEEPATLEYVVGFLEYGEQAAGAWQDQLPVWQTHLERAAQFTWQTMPVADVRVRFVGGVTPYDLGLEPDTDDPLGEFFRLVGQGYTKLLSEKAARAFMRHNCTSSRQFCVIIMPPGGSNHAHVTEPGARGAYLTSSVLSLVSDRVDGSRVMNVDGVGLTHEAGHSFGLVHRPLTLPGPSDFGPYLQEAGLLPGIDAIRMDRSGLGGAVKSSDTGNSEAARFLAPLMFPNLVGEDAQFIMDDNYRFLMDSIYALGAGGELFDTDFAIRHRFEGKTYTEMRDQLRRDEVSLHDTVDDGAASVILPLRLGQAEAGAAVDGVSLGLILAMDDDTGVPLLTHGLRPSRAVPLDDLARADGPRFTLSFEAAGLVVLTRDFTLRSTTALAARAGADILVDLDLFLPLDPATRDQIDRITLTDAAGTLLLDRRLPGLPAAVETVADPDGTLRLIWDAAGIAPAVISVLPQGADRPVPAGIASGGSWTPDPAALGVAGPATVTLTFDTGLRTRVFDLPVTLAPRFVSPLAMIAGDGARPDIVIVFNRPPGADLPAFSLQGETDAAPTPTTAVVAGDRLVLVPDADLAPCGRWRILAEGPVRDTEGLGLSGRGEWSVARDGPACAGEVSAGADVTLTAGGRVQDLSGSAIRRPDGTILLDLDLLAVAIVAPGPGTHPLISVDPGATRRDLTLRFGPGGTDAGTLTLETDPGGTTARFNGVWDGRELAGRLTLIE